MSIASPADFAKKIDPRARRSGGGGWMCRCPAHADRTPSLHVSPGRSHAIVFTCHAGCPAEAVLGAAGLDWADLGLAGRRSGPPPAPPRATLAWLPERDRWRPPDAEDHHEALERLLHDSITARTPMQRDLVRLRARVLGLSRNMARRFNHPLAPIGDES